MLVVLGRIILPYSEAMKQLQDRMAIATENRARR
jgi:hypothetical protein